jgi:hypothetical protein
LGGELLSSLLRSTDGWRELPCELIQPVCWSNPGAFFTIRSSREHELVFDDGALCYMLSNNEVRKFQTAAPGRDLLAEGTFFRYLAHKALGTLTHGNSEPLRVEPTMHGIFSGMIDLFARYGEESLSGPGSSLAQTAELRRRLPGLLADIRVESMLDAPCGDFNWMRHVPLDIAYTGADVVEKLVIENRRRHAGERRSFVCLDITRDALPRVDLILSRDCLVHLCFSDIFRSLANFRRSQSEYLLTTTFPNVRFNHEIATGEWRPLNFEDHPFYFPPPIRLINEKCTEGGGRYADKSLGLWKLAELPIVPRMGPAAGSGNQ